MPFLMSTHRSGGTLGGTPEAFAFTGMDIKKAPHTQGKCARHAHLGERKDGPTPQGQAANIRAVQEGLREGLRGRKHDSGGLLGGFLSNELQRASGKTGTSQIHVDRGDVATVLLRDFPERHALAHVLQVRIDVVLGPFRTTPADNRFDAENGARGTDSAPVHANQLADFAVRLAFRNQLPKFGFGQSLLHSFLGGGFARSDGDSEALRGHDGQMGHGSDPGLFAQNAPRNIGAQFLAGNGLALFAGGSFQRRAVLRRKATIRVEPRPDGAAVFVTEGSRHSRLPSKNFGSALQCGLFASELR